MVRTPLAATSIDIRERLRGRWSKAS
jgi:hypothetical protein